MNRIKRILLLGDVLAFIAFFSVFMSAMLNLGGDGLSFTFIYAFIASVITLPVMAAITE